MTHPKCKAEARWKYWREENCLFCKGKFAQYAKKMMKKARRRFLNNPKNIEK